MAPSLLRFQGTLLLKSDRCSISRAASIIRKGGLVAFPTETVYGLGAAASDARAVGRIFRAKGRPSDNPLIVHICHIRQLNEVALGLPVEALELAKRFWPGPLSLVLQRASSIPPEVSAGLPTVAVRMPDHPVALDLIRASGVPLAAPSANRSGHPSPTSFRHVLEDLAGRIEALIISDTCSIGLESTVLDLSGTKPVILRPGGITREMLEEALGVPVAVAGKIKEDHLPSSPGMKYRHYAPRAPLILITGTAKYRRRLIEALCEHYGNRGLSVGLLNEACSSGAAERVDQAVLSASLYKALRQMDQRGVDLILAEETEPAGLGLAIMNRLRKAAARVLRV